MRKLLFKKIDAFASENSSGNPAGFVLLNSFADISAEQMLGIARELKGYVNEVGFVAENDGVLELRYYSAEREVEFCGHATIAIMYTMINSDAQLMACDEIAIKAGGELLTVKNEIASQDAVFITAPSPKYKATNITADKVAQVLGIKTEDIGTSPEVINAGLDTLLVEITSLDTILAISPYMEDLKEFCEQNDVDIIEVFCKETSCVESFYRTRVFAPRFGYLEDPATGSGNSAFGYYLLKHGLWNGKAVSIEQNGERDRYNTVKLLIREEDKTKKVMFGGSAAIRIEEFCFAKSFLDLVEGIECV